MGRITKTVDDTREMFRKIARKYTFLHHLGIGFWIFLILMFIIGIFSIVFMESLINLMVSDYGYFGILIAALITDLLVQPVGPDVPLVLGVISGVLNPWIVLCAILLGSYLALFFAYNIGRTIGAAGIERIVGKKNFEKIDKYKAGGRWFMFIAALSPVPYIPYLAGLWEFKFRNLMIFVVFPRTLRFVIVFLLLYFLGITI